MLLIGVMVVSCSHIQDQTVDQHRNEAQIHLEKARVEEAKVDPSDVMRAAPHTPGNQLVGNDVPFEPYNPSEEHVAAADRELREANEHFAAADKLLAFEDKACTGLSAGERSSCPLFASSVNHVTWIKDGFRLNFTRAADMQSTYRRLSCHLAYAIAAGFDRPSCPLFIKGTTLRKEGADGLEFAGDSAQVADALRAQARRIFLGSVKVATSPR